MCHAIDFGFGISPRPYMSGLLKRAFTASEKLALLLLSHFSILCWGDRAYVFILYTSLIFFKPKL